MNMKSKGNKEQLLSKKDKKKEEKTKCALKYLKSQ